jgi:hypothetical protein
VIGAWWDYRCTDETGNEKKNYEKMKRNGVATGKIEKEGGENRADSVCGPSKGA